MDCGCFVVSHGNLIGAFAEKMKKYEKLRRRLKESMKLASCEVVPVIVSYKGLILKASEEKMEQLAKVPWPAVLRRVLVKAAQIVLTCMAASY